MRISFASIERPRRIAKALHRQFSQSSPDLRFTRVQEATAVMFGYRGWNDLKAQVGREPASPFDQDCAAETVLQRRSTFAERLASALDLPIGATIAAVTAVGPTSRGAGHTIDWDKERRDIAASLSAEAKIVTRRTVDGLDGIVMENGERSHFLYVAEDGSRLRWMHRLIADPNTFIVPKSAGGIGDGALFARRANRPRLDPGFQSAEPHPLILAMTMRLSPAALSLLWWSPVWTPADYERAFALDEDAPFRRLAERLPMIAGELMSNPEWSSADTWDDEEERGYGSGARIRASIWKSRDPLTAYIDLCSNYARLNWKSVSFDKQRARTAIEAVAKICVLQEFLPMHAAFFSVLPEGAWPTNAASMKAAMSFISNHRLAFKYVHPDAFINDMKEAFDFDWSASGNFPRSDDLHFRETAGETLFMKVSAELGDVDMETLDPDEFQELIDRFNDALRPHLSAGRGLRELAAHMHRLSSGVAYEWGADDAAEALEALDHDFKMLVAPDGPLPAELRLASAEQVLDAVLPEWMDLRDHIFDHGTLPERARARGAL